MNTHPRSYFSIDNRNGPEPLNKPKIMKKDKIHKTGRKIIGIAKKENFTGEEFKFLLKNLMDWWKTVESRLVKGPKGPRGPKGTQIK